MQGGIQEGRATSRHRQVAGWQLQHSLFRQEGCATRGGVGRHIQHILHCPRHTCGMHAATHSISHHMSRDSRVHACDTHTLALPCGLAVEGLCKHSIN